MSDNEADYTDARHLHPGYERKECWNCGNTWFRRPRPAESICRACFMGQGDHDRVDEPTDYGELWYGDVSLEKKRRQHAEMKAELRDRRLDDAVEVPYAGRGPALATVWNNPTRVEEA